MSANENKRIAKNAVYLYGRMLLTVGVSLYTARVVLDTLGVDNYAIYNLVGGIVAIMSFINGTMALATQRFLNYEMGLGDPSRLQRTFSNAMIIHIAIAGLLLAVGETAGLWYVNNRLVIPPDRLFAANVTYQLSMLAAIAGIVQIPYLASVMAHERMDFYALIAILNVLLKLAVALSILLFATLDSLVVYATLMLLAAMLVMLLYRAYCKRHFPECRFRWKIDREIFSSMLRFSGWDLYGNLSYTTRMQGTIVILNNFGGLVLNAAGNLTLTVSGTITSFAGSIVTAFRPQIIQQYAKQNYPLMQTLINNCARYSFLLMGLLVVPLFLEMNCLLSIWLPEVPEYTATFCRIALLAACGELLVIIVCIGIHATGRIKMFSFITGTLYLLELPVMYFLLRHTGQPPLVYVVHCCFILIILFTDTVILHNFVPKFSIPVFWFRGFLVPLLIVGAAGILASLVCAMGDESLIRAVLTSLASAALIMAGTFCFGIDGPTRRKVIAKASQIAHRGR